MNCEMAQRTIALAALGQLPARLPALPSRDTAAISAQRLPASSHTQYCALESQPEGEPAFLGAPSSTVSEALGESASPGAATTPASVDLPLDPLAFSEVELQEDERLALEEHLAGCRECQAEMAATAAFYRALSQSRDVEPTPSLLARARLRLDAKLDENAHQSILAHLLQQLSFSAGRLRAAPGLASALLFVGVALGAFAGYRAGHAAHNAEQAAWVLTPPDDPTVAAETVASVSSIVHDAGSEQVEVSYQRLEPDTITGSLDDPWIRRLLMAGVRNGISLPVRNLSLSLLASECREGHACRGGPIRDALLNALESDSSPQVRIEALNGLEPYISEDVQVRDAVLRAVMADASPDVRIEAIRLLTPVEVDSTVRQALHRVSQDGDPSIRDASQRLLNGMPQLQ